MPEFRDSIGAPFRRIGQVELLTEQTYRNASFGCAAWWEDIACLPQTVELKSNGYWVCWGFEGIVTDAHFPALFGGVPVSAYDKTRDIDKPGRHPFQWYTYGFAQQRMTGNLPDEMLFHMDPQFGCGVGTYRHDATQTRARYFLTISNAEAQRCSS